MLTGLPLDGWKPAPARGAVRNILRCELLQGASTEPQVLDRPGQPALGRSQREHFSDHGELLTGVSVDVYGPRLDLADDLAVTPGAQAV
jgi:hypothetical protein